MTSRRSLSLFAALPALALACATTTSYRVEANVRTLRAGARDAAGITAVAGAELALQCPDASASRPLGKTDGRGALTVEGDGAIPLACKVSISEPGYRELAVAVADACTEKVMGACRTLDIRALLPAAESSSAAAR